MVDTMSGAGDPAAVPKTNDGGGRNRGRSIWTLLASSSLLLNISGRTERALRMALGGALIMALTMCDIPSMHYSFKYIGPFLFFVVGTLAPPFLSSAVIILFSGLFCILVACAVATALLSCLLVTTGGQALCVFVYAVTVVWASFLTVGKAKDMTLIGSYVLLYAVPLATLIASAYARAGISVDVTPEVFAALRQFVANSSLEQIRESASQFFLISVEDVDAIMSKIANPMVINVVLGLIWQSLRIPGKAPTIPPNTPINPKQALNFFLGIAARIPAGRPLAFDTKVPRDMGVSLPQDWMYEAPLFVDGVSGEHVLVGARPGFWLIRAMWVASGPIGMLRNLIIFAFLGFAVYLLVILVPPIRRQRDVAVREMAFACNTLCKCLRTYRRDLEQTDGQNVELEAVKIVGEGKGERDAADNGQISASESKTDTALPSTVDALDAVVLNLIESEKAVLLSGMEPFLLYPGPGVWAMRELDAVRKRLIQCCIQTQHMAQLFHNAKTGKLAGAGGSGFVLPPHASPLLAKSVEMYELCEKLLTTFPSIFAPSNSKKQANDIIEQMSALEKEMRSLALQIFRPVELEREEALLGLETDAIAVSGLRNSDDEAVKQKPGDGKSLERAIDLLPFGLATTAFVHAGYSEPFLLAHCITALNRAQQVNTWRGLLMNIVFPFVPFLVHLNRLVVAPLSSLAFWRLTWRGPDAWWRNPETWYAVKLVIPLICIFACAIYLPDFRQYSWGTTVTNRPIFLDFSTQSITTRMVPWFLLGFLTVLQTTYNGTVHRSLCRTIGILLGGFCGWLGLTWTESNLAGLIAFCSVTVFLDIFIFADPEHPLDGFHKKWGYSGMVFTYTQVLVVTLATEELGGLTGSKDYLVTSRILSNIMGILLAVIVTHLPPLASSTTSACTEYSRVVQYCSTGFNKLIHSFLCICGDLKDEHCATSVVEDTAAGASPSVASEREKVSAVSKTLDLECKDHLGSAVRLFREGRYVPVLSPWRASPSLAKVHVAIKSIVIEAQNAAQLVSDITDDDSQQKPATGSSAQVVPSDQELGARPFERMPSQGGFQGERALSKSVSMSLMQHGNSMAIRELFQTSKGKELREALRSMSDSISTLAAAASVELCSSLPAFGNKIMCCQGKYTQQQDSPGGPQQAYENCRGAADSNSNRVITALAECLGEHCAAHRDARAARTVSAFVVMKLLYHLQSVKFSLDEVHAAVIEGSK